MNRAPVRAIALPFVVVVAVGVGCVVAAAHGQAVPGSCAGRTDARPACPIDARFSGPGGCEYEPSGFWSSLFGYRSHCRLSDCGICIDGELIDEERGLCCGMPSPPSDVGVDFLLADHVNLGGSRPEGTNDLVHLVRGYQRFFLPPTFVFPVFRWRELATYTNEQPTGTPAALREVRAVDYGPAIGGASGTWLYTTGLAGRPDCVRAVNKLPSGAAFLATVSADAEGRIYRRFRPPSFQEANHLCPAGPGDDLVVTDDAAYTSASCGGGCDGRIFRLDRTTGEEELWLTLPLDEIGFWAGNFAFDGDGRLYVSSGNLAHGASIYRVDGVGTATPTLTRLYRRPAGPIMGFDFGPTGHLYFTEGSSRIFELRGFSSESLFGDFPAPTVRRIFDITFPD